MQAEIKQPAHQGAVLVDVHDLSSFDDDVLRSLMQELALVEFDMELTGFDTAERAGPKNSPIISSAGQRRSVHAARRPN